MQVSQSKRNSSLDWNHVDFSQLQPMMQFTDIAHVTQQSNELIASHLARELVEFYPHIVLDFNHGRMSLQSGNPRTVL